MGLDKHDEHHDNHTESFIYRVKKTFKGKVVNVEFHCGDCCKKVIKGKLHIVTDSFIELVEDDHSIKVITFSVAKKFVEHVEKIIIPVKLVFTI